ncbi:hypothetical protein Hypma_012516 [Hypsizygus marmoreus]|nr:hypothetical protein Hypma_012516 [Hypsizygus marmoreus]
MRPPYLEGQGLSAFQFNLTNLMNLSQLSITIGLLYFKSNDLKDCLFTSIQQLTTFLASAAFTLAHIERLTVVFSPLWMHPHHDVWHMAKWLSEFDVWEQLDETISHCRSTAELRVTLILKMRLDELTQMLEVKKEWQESMRGKFPMLEKRGALTLDMVSHSQARIQ